MNTIQNPLCDNKEHDRCLIWKMLLIAKQQEIERLEMELEQAKGENEGLRDALEYNTRSSLRSHW